MQFGCCWLDWIVFAKYWWNSFAFAMQSALLHDNYRLLVQLTCRYAIGMHSGDYYIQTVCRQHFSCYFAVAMVYKCSWCDDAHTLNLQDAIRQYSLSSAHKSMLLQWCYCLVNYPIELLPADIPCLYLHWLVWNITLFNVLSIRHGFGFALSSLCILFTDYQNYLIVILLLLLVSFFTFPSSYSNTLDFSF